MGVGGMVRAYSGAVSDAVNCAQLLQVTPQVQIHISVDFSNETKIRHTVNQYHGQILNVDYAAEVTLTVSLAAAQADLFVQQVINETSGDTLVKIDEAPK